MSNEELAALVKQGRADLLTPLWQGVERFVRAKALSRATSVQRSHDVDDLCQEAYLQLSTAANMFDPSAGSSFLNFYSHYFLPRAFNLALYNAPKPKDPIDYSLSLDSEVSTEDISVSLLDTLEDPAASAAFDSIDDHDLTRSVRSFLLDAIDRLPYQEKTIIRFLYGGSHSVRDAFRHSLIGPVSYQRYAQVRLSGLSHLKKYINGSGRSLAKKAGIFEIVPDNTNYHLRYGLKSFKATHTSAVELAVFYRDRHGLISDNGVSSILRKNL